jgi:DUF3014 family protein
VEAFLLMKNTSWWLVLILILGATGAGYYYWQRSQAPPPVQIETPPAPQAPAEPQIRHPLAEAQPGPPLPALNESDGAMQDAMAGVVGKKSLDQFFPLNDMARRFVATIDNLPRKKVAQRLMPVKPVPGRLVTSGEGENLAIAAANYSRYTPYVRLAEAVDSKKLVAMYVHFYPLFQQAYVELGYPTGYFNDRLVEAIDNLLATPESQGPVRLIQPKVLYQFADPELEALPAGQKILVRVGNENAARIKVKLREIRQEVAGEGPKR